MPLSEACCGSPICLRGPAIADVLDELGRAVERIKIQEDGLDPRGTRRGKEGQGGDKEAPPPIEMNSERANKTRMAVVTVRVDMGTIPKRVVREHLYFAVEDRSLWIYGFLQ